MTTININLLPEELRAKPSGGGSLGDMPPPEAMKPIGIGLAIAVVVGLVPMLMENYMLLPREEAVQAEEDRINREISKYKEMKNSLQALEQKKELLRQQVATLETVAGGRMQWAEMLNELRSVTPGNLWFDSMRTDSTKSTLQVSGAALDYSSVAYFYRNLQNSDYFDQPVLSRTEMSNGANGVSLVNFTVDVTFRKVKKS